MHRFRRRTIVLSFAFATLVACGDSSGPTPAHVGTYTLRTVHGKPLPVILNGAQLQVFAGAITLRKDGTYTRTWSTEFYQGPGAPTIPNPMLQCRGTYTVQPAFVDMTEATSTTGCYSYDAGFKADTIFFVQDTLFGVYVK